MDQNQHGTDYIVNIEEGRKFASEAEIVEGLQCRCSVGSNMTLEENVCRSALTRTNDLRYT